MVKIKDRILLGVLSGILVGAPGRITNAIEYKLGLTDVKYQHLAASLFLPQDRLNTTEAHIIGSLANNFNLSLVGILTVYLLSITGKDKAILKGAGACTSFWLLFYGMAGKVLLKRRPKPLALILSFIDHLLCGSLMGLAASRLGDESLFPDGRLTDEGWLPVLPSPETTARSPYPPINSSRS